MEPWSTAWQRAALEFYGRAPGAPDLNFRTGAELSGDAVIVALGEFVLRLDRELDRPHPFTVVDVGAGSGRLLSALAKRLEQLARSGSCPAAHLLPRLAGLGVDLRPAPAGLGAWVSWCEHGIGEPGAEPCCTPRMALGASASTVSGLVVAHELLDDFPIDIAMYAGGSARLLLVDPVSGVEALGRPLRAAELGWLHAWWPGSAAQLAGARVELGGARDRAWQACVGLLGSGLAVGVDYGHLRAERLAGGFAQGTVAGNARGRAVRPVLDGSVNLTAHVAMDAVQAAGAQVSGDPGTLLRQREALALLRPTAPPKSAGVPTRQPEERLQAWARGVEAAAAERGPLGERLWLLQQLNGSDGLVAAVLAG